MRFLDPRWAPRSTAGRYAFAIIVCTLAAIATGSLLVVGEIYHAFSAFLAAILLSAWYGGAGPAVLAVLLATLMDRALPFMLGYPDTLWLDVGDLWFFVFGIGAAWFGAARRRLMLDLETTRSELQAAMLARTHDLQRKDKYLSAAEELSHLGYWASPLDPAAERIWSAEFYRNLGLEPFSVQASTQLFWSFVHPDDRDALREHITSSIAQGKRFQVEHRIIRADGTIRTIYGVGQPIVVDGEVREYVGVTMDVTDLRAAQSAERRSRGRAVRARFEARLSERNRLARELHDTLLQGFTGVSLQLLAATRAMRGPREDVEALERVLGLAEHTLVEARRAIFDLREPKPRLRLPDELRVLLEERVRDTGIRSCLEIAGTPRRIRREARKTILRVVGEAVMNAVKHSAARNVHVLLSYSARDVRIEVTDDGCGFLPSGGLPPAHGHYGLIGMRERAAHIGGVMHVTSKPGRGTTICLIICGRGTRSDGKNDDIHPPG